MNRGELAYIMALVLGVLTPGAILFYVFNIPLTSPHHGLDPFNKFIAGNWMMIILTSIAIAAATTAILRMLGYRILNYRERSVRRSRMMCENEIKNITNR